MPFCCSAHVICDFNTSDKEKITEYIAIEKERLFYQKVLLATTSDCADGNWAPNHRQDRMNQSAAEECLKRCGFRRLKPFFNASHHHSKSGVTLWYLRVRR